MKRSEREIAVQEKFLAEHGVEDASHTERAAALREANEGRAEILIDEARKHSERNPTDLQLRFELGRTSGQRRTSREALPELQRARQNPNARLKAMNLLGKCYRELGMLDLAVNQLDEAGREILTMDAMKNEITHKPRPGLREDGRTPKIPSPA